MPDADMAVGVEHAMACEDVIGNGEVPEQRRLDGPGGSRGILRCRLRADRSDRVPESEPAANHGFNQTQALHRQPLLASGPHRGAPDGKIA